MRRLVTILVAAAIVAFGIVWIADRQGALIFLIDGYEVRMTAAVAIGIGIIFALLIAFITRIVGAVTRSPAAVGRWSFARKQRKGDEALSRGLVAAAAGDEVEARRQAQKAQSLVGASPLALLLSAQAAQLGGDEEAQSGAYRAMLAHPETEFVGLRGLFMQARRRDDEDEAMALATRAHQLKPRAAWAANALFDLKSARGEWSEAKKVLDASARAKLIDPGVTRRRRAVLLSAEALEAQNRGDNEHALSLAQKAISLSPGLTPAAVVAARELTAANKMWRAQDVIEAAWAQAPHPDLAAAYAAIKPNESAAERAERMKGLAQLNRDHFESRMLLAEQAANQSRWLEARRLLAPLAGGFASSRVCALMAEIEQSEKHDASAAHAWLERAVRAPRDAEWRCANCGWADPAWHAVCGNCGAFDSLSWQAPGAGALELMAPGDGGEELGPEAAPVLYGPPSQDDFADDDETPVLPKPSTPPKPQSKPAAKSPPAKTAGNDGFVVLPRPPDDPGPDSYDEDDGKTSNTGGY